MNPFTQVVAVELPNKIVHIEGNLLPKKVLKKRSSLTLSDFPILKNLLDIFKNEFTHREHKINIKGIEFTAGPLQNKIIDLCLQQCFDGDRKCYKFTLHDLTNHYKKLCSHQQSKQEKLLREQTNLFTRN